MYVCLSPHPQEFAIQGKNSADAEESTSSPGLFP